MITAQELHRGMAFVRGIWFAMFASLILYVAIAPMLFNTSITFSEQGYRTLRLALYGAALLTLVLTWLIRRLLLRGSSRPTKPTRSGQHPSVSRYVSVMMVTMGMSEAIGVYGLILYVLGQQRQDLYLLTLLSAAAMLLYFPKREEILNLAQEMARQR